jgi:hypothetical protein
MKYALGNMLGASKSMESKYSTICCCGDSITDRISHRDSAYEYIVMSTDGWGAALETLSGQRIRSVSRGNTGISGTPPPSNDRDHGYSGITAEAYLIGSASTGSSWLGSVIPIEWAKNTNADLYVVHVGTNDLPNVSLTPQQVADRVIAIWLNLVAAGKKVIGTDILQRTATYSGWNSTLRDKVNLVNSILRSSWQSSGIKGYRQWDNLVDKDVNGYAASIEFPNDGIHPTQRIGHKLGKDLLNYLQIKNLKSTPPVIPSSGSALWLTPNPYVEGNQGNGLAPSWAGIGISLGTNATASKITDQDGSVWQRLSLSASIAFSQAGLYSRITSGIPASGTRVRATAKVKIPSAGALTSINLQVQQINAPQASDWMELFGRGGGTAISSPLISGDEYFMHSEPFTIQSGVTQLWLLVGFTCASGGSVYEFKEAGIYLDPL